MSDDALKNLGLDEALAELAEEQVDEVQVLARGALNTMFVLFRLSTIHSLNNEAFLKPIDTMVKIFEAYRGRGGSFALMVKGDNFFVNNTMVRLDTASFQAAQYLVRAWEGLGIGAVTANGRVGEEHIREMLEKLVETLALSPRQRLGAMVGEKFGAIEIRSEVGAGDPLVELKREIQRLYAILAIAAKEFVDLGLQDRFPPLKRLKRLTQRYCDVLGKNPRLAASISCYNGGDEHEMFHRTNVAVLSMFIARALKIPKKDAVLLGIAALLHDMGLDDRPGMKGARPIPESVELLMQFKGLNEHTLLWTVVADELAMYSRYVPTRSQWYYGGEGPGLFARIMHVAHRYERRINGPADRTISPHTAVLQAMQDARGECDPRVVKAFIDAIGLFPLGTLVQLTDGSMAAVIRNYEQPEMAALPAVRPIAGHEGRHDPEQVLELGDPGVRVKIVAAVQPSQLRINPTAEVLI